MCLLEFCSGRFKVKEFFSSGGEIYFKTVHDEWHKEDYIF